MTVIGWIALVAAVLFLFKALLDLVLWEMLRSGAPNLMRRAAEDLPNLPVARFWFEHTAAVKLGQAVWWLAVAISAWQLLRLREWARVAIQIACAVAFFYAAAFAIFWVYLSRRIALEAASDPTLAHRVPGPAGVFAGEALCLVVGATMAWVIALLQSPPVRAAFGRVDAP